MGELGFAPTPEELVRQAQESLRAGNADDAIEKLQQALLQAPSDANALGLLGAAYAQKEMYAEAIQQFNAAIQRGPAQASLHYNLGVMYQRTGDNERARQSFETALQVDPNYTRARDALGIIPAAQPSHPPPSIPPSAGTPTSSTGIEWPCANHPSVPATHYCGSCGKPICAQCERSSFGLILCEECYAARQVPTSELSGAPSMSSSVAPSTVGGGVSAYPGARILRPMGYGDLLDEVLDLYKNNFALVVGTVALLDVPAQLLTTYVIFSSYTPVAGRGGPPAPDPAMFLPFFLSIMLLAVVTVFSQGALTKAVAETYLGRKTTIMQCYAFMLPRIFSFLAVSIVAGLVTMVGFLLCCVGAFWGIFAPECFVVEGTGATKSVERSMFLAKGNWGRCFVVIFLMAILIQIITSIITYPLQYAAASMTGSPSAMVTLNAIGNAIAHSLLSPLQLILVVLLYFDIRVRKEGFDIEMLADNLRTRG